MLKKIGNFIFNFILIYMSVIAISCLCFNLKPGLGLGASMMPTHPALQITLETQNIDKSKLKRYDVISFERRNKILCKRVIGLPGETFEMIDGRSYINGQLLEEPFEYYPVYHHIGPIEIGEDEIFVLGDNRPRSLDSKAFGPIKLDSIIAKESYTLKFPQPILDIIAKIGKLDRPTGQRLFFN